MDNTNSALDLVSVEKKHLKRWDDINLFEKINTKGLESGRKWVYYDGPITANGRPHYGHAITWTLKDVFPRYYSMQNYYVSRNIGWDCQGILVEYEIEKQLGFSHKSEIEKMGVENFNNLCRANVLKNREKMYEYETRIGRFIDKSVEYSTMDSSYIESTWYAIKKLYEKGLLYEGYKVVAYSPRTGMTLSTHEVADGGYKEVEDTAVCVKFKLVNIPNTYVLAWTTTPWTLPGNLLLAIGAKIEYVKVECNKEFYILAKERVAEIFKDKEYKIIEAVKVLDLVDKEYEPLFNYYNNKKNEGCFKIVTASHVNTTDGTGVVHLAPYGEEDFNVFLEKKIKVFDYLNETGEFTNEIKEYEGIFYKKANDLIVQKLEKENKLFFSNKYLHSMPVDYRSGTPLIYKPIKSWYVNIDKIKTKLIEEAKKVNFVPKEMGTGRFVPWITNARDWSLSRLRFWGTPLPIWKNDKTGELVIIGSFEELEKLSERKLDSNFDPHKPFVDEITWEDRINGGVFKRLPEVIDVWFDSGSMPFARYHFPFENQETFQQNFPAEYISEGDDQLRLWFYTMFVLGVALFDKSPFKNVVVIGMLGDEKGKKMSKSKGNYPPVEEVFEKYGSDSFRYFLLTSQVVRGDATSFSYKELDEVKKEFLTVFWNSYKYFNTYADIHNFDFQTDFKKPENVIDKWILSVFENTKKRIIKYTEEYEIMFATREFAPLIQNISTWYIRRSRDRLSSNDKYSLGTLYYVLYEFSIMLAPFLPFLSDEVYLQITKGNLKESVHLETYPKVNQTFIDESLEKDMQLVRDICSLANAIRKEINIPVKQPLQTLYVVGEKLDTELIVLIKDEINVKEVVFIKTKKEVPNSNISSKDDKVFLDTNISPQLKLEGDYRSLVRIMMDLRKDKGLKIGEKVKFQLEDTPQNKEILKVFGEELKNKVDADEVKLGTQNCILQI